MALSSMTGFARVDGALGETRWTWEMKSVNGRGFEPRFRLPPGYDFLEHDLRKLLAEKFSRGSFNIFLSLKGAAVEGAIVVTAGRPHVVSSRCDGCGNCVAACPAPILAFELRARREVTR